MSASAQNSHFNRAIDSGLWAILSMAALHSIVADKTKLVHEYGAPFDAQKILLAAQSLGMSAKAIVQDPSRLTKAPLPAVAQALDGSFFILAKIIQSPVAPKAHDSKMVDTSVESPKTKVLIQKAGERPSVILLDELFSLWTGELLFFTSKASFAGAMAKFDFTWFIPAIVKYRKLLVEILIISLALQIIGLVTPMFFQVVMDKVLVNHAMKTLNVIAIGLMSATIFEAVLTGIRTWVFAHTSSKIDVELGARLFRHLLGLPIAYFQSRRVGDSVARIRELENIRSFLTGNAMTLVLDLLFSFIFLAIILWYSALLTLIVMVSIPLYLMITSEFANLFAKEWLFS